MTFVMHLERLFTPKHQDNWGKIRQVYPPKNFLPPISLKVREIIVLVNLFQFP